MTTPISTEHLQAIQEQFNQIPLFACLYISSSNRSATYTVMRARDEGVDFNQVLYLKQVNIVTGDVLNEYSSFHSDLTLALGHHFNADYIRQEAVTLSFELIENMTFYVRDGEFTLHDHNAYGRAVYYSDLDELHIRATDKALHIITRQV